MAFELAAFAGTGSRKCTKGKAGSSMMASSVLTAMSRTWLLKNTIDDRFIVCSLNLDDTPEEILYGYGINISRYG
jgi:hypothetical protein